MGLIDSIKNAFDGDDSNDSDLVNKAQDAANAHDERLDAGVDTAGDFVDDKTGARFEGHVDRGQDYIQDNTGNI